MSCLKVDNPRRMRKKKQDSRDIYILNVLNIIPRYIFRNSVKMMRKCEGITVAPPSVVVCNELDLGHDAGEISGEWFSAFAPALARKACH